MTTQEIKDKNPMPEVIKRYSKKIKGNMCSCPFHKDENPSMKIFPDAAKCFSCGWYGDVFKLVMDADNCDFKTAFKVLGGTYEHGLTERQKMAEKMRWDIEKSRRKRAEEAEKDFSSMLWLAIRTCRHALRLYEPYSDEWCLAANKLPFLENAYDMKYILNEEINEIDIYTTSRAIIKRFL